MNLGVSFNKDQTEEIFSFLDIGGDGFIDYNEFCRITQEKWRNIDPFEHNKNFEEASINSKRSRSLKAK